MKTKPKICRQKIPLPINPEKIPIPTDFPCNGKKIPIHSLPNRNQPSTVSSPSGLLFAARNVENGKNMNYRKTRFTLAQQTGDFSNRIRNSLSGENSDSYFEHQMEMTLVLP